MQTILKCRQLRLHLIGAAVFSFAMIGCAREKPAPVVPARAVTVIELAEIDPAATLRLPGSVAPWKQEDVAFQVGGRVAWVIEADRDVTGPGSDAAYEPYGPGDAIARLDKSRYLAASASAEANLAAAAAQVEATRVLAQEIVIQEIKQAEIEQGRSKTYLERIKRAVLSGSVSEQELNNADAAFATAVANFAALRAKKTRHEVELKVHEAQRQQSIAAVRQAELDLEDTELLAPFDARVTEVHATPGTIVAAGTPVATMVVLDPVKVEVVVSAARDRQVKTNDEVLIYTADRKDAGDTDPIPAIVYQKSAVANSTTRTFTVTLLCRNRRIESFTGSDYVAIDGFMRPQQFEVNGKWHWFVRDACIHEDDDGGHFAWRVVNPDGRSEDEPLDLQRVNLKLGEIHKNFFGVFKFRQLSPEDSLVPELKGSDYGQRRWQTVLAAGVPDNYTGGNVIKSTRRWELRPGDIVEVQLDVEAPESGIYVPKNYIRVEGTEYFVFLVGGAEGSLTAKKVAVSVTATVGNLHRIEGDGIRVGARMITSGVHYLQDGTDIEIFEVVR